MFQRYGPRIFLVIFAIYALTLTVPYGYAGLGLDPSWNLGINMLISRGAIFGQDVAFTYGPLGFLNYRVLPENYSVYTLLIFDLGFVALSTWFVGRLLARAGRYWYVISAVALYLFYPDGLFADRIFSLLTYEFALLMYAYQFRKAWPLLVGALIAVLLVFVKVNVLFIAGPYLLFILGLMAWTGRLRLSQLVGILVLYLGGIVSLCALLHVDFLSYALNSIPLTNAYMDAMASFSLYAKEFVVLGSLELGLWAILAWVIWKNWGHVRGNGLVYLSGMFLLLLSYKQTHVGISFAGYRNFFMYFPLPVLLIWSYSSEEQQGIWKRAWVGILLVQVIGILYTGYGVSERSWSRYLDTRPVPHLNLSYYFVPFTWYDYAKNFEEHALDLPDSTRSLIGRGTVDVLQHDLGYAFFNRLNYVGRPVIQSYSAYSPELIRLNGRHYESSKAPEWVLFKLEPYRTQNPFWMDSEVEGVLMRRYALRQMLVVKGDTLSLFHRRAEARPDTFARLTVGQMELGKRIQLPGQRAWMQVDARLNLWGHLMRLVFQPPYLYVRVHYVDGQERRYRVVEPVLRSGIWTGVRVETQDDLRRYYQSGGRDNVPMDWMEFESNVPWAWE